MTLRFADQATAKYLMLTTFKKNGTPVGTPIWAAPDGEDIVVWTETDSWKVKRIRRNPTVTVQECGMRGQLKAGAPVLTGRARIVEGADADGVRGVIAKKYGIMGQILVRASVLRRGKAGTVGLVIVPDPSAQLPQPAQA